MSAFFCAKTLTTAPVEIVQVFVFAVIVYFMTGYQARLPAPTFSWSSSPASDRLPAMLCPLNDRSAVFALRVLLLPTAVILG